MTHAFQDRAVLVQLAPTDVDPAELGSLFSAVEAVEHRHPLSEKSWLELVAGLRQGSFALVAHQNSEIVGYVHVRHGDRRQRQWEIEPVVQPAMRDGHLTADLVRAALDECRTRNGGHPQVWVVEPTPSELTELQRLGLVTIRALLEMRVPLPHPEASRFPPEVVLRPFDVERDAQSWLQLNNAAFAEHPDQGDWGIGDLRPRLVQPWFRPAGFLLAVEAGRPIGFCWTKQHGHEGLGEIYVVGVDPAHQHRGLGRALVLAGLHSLTDAGSTLGSLFVEADNRAALRLYESLGFTVHRHHHAFAPPH